MTEELSRASALASRHRDLGSGLEDWNGMGTAWTYNTDPNDEHDAVREAAGLFDMSPLKKVYLRGPDAATVADHIITRDIAKTGPGRATYGTILTDRGTVCDDSIISNNGGNEFMAVHGSGNTMDRLTESAKGKNIDLEFDDDLHDISLQGPKALDVLVPHTPMDLAALKYFHHQETELFGHKCRISRTGYSGERGYEIFADKSVIGDIWDSILGHGKAAGVMPCSFTALDKVRIEAGLLFFGYDMTDEHTPWEVGLGFTVTDKKGAYRGHDAIMSSKGKERILCCGIVAEYGDALAGGEKLLLTGEDVGVVNSPAWSHRMEKSLALSHLRVDVATVGTKLEVAGEGIACAATVEPIPFFDPLKARVRA